MKSDFYYSGACKEVAQEVLEHINASQEFMSEQTAGSTRAVGDAIETVIADVFDSLLGDWCTEYSSDFARRAMADLAFTDKDGFYSVVDVKTHREDTSFNMPNLTSVQRLSRFYESDENVFSILLVRYRVQDTKINATEIKFCPIEFLDWDCLTIGALGWGQIQLANSNQIQVNDGYSRKQWMLQLCDALLAFYPNEIMKINERISRFEEIRSTWDARQDVW